MNVNINIGFANDTLKSLLTKIIGKIMNPILEAVQQQLTEISDLKEAVIASQELLIVEVRKLIAMGDLEGADALLAEAQEVKEDLAAAVVANTELTAEVDAVNG
jgi:hypothetical protein